MTLSTTTTTTSSSCRHSHSHLCFAADKEVIGTTQQQEKKQQQLGARSFVALLRSNLLNTRKLPTHETNRKHEQILLMTINKIYLPPHEDNNNNHPQTNNKNKSKNLLFSARSSQEIEWVCLVTAHTRVVECWMCVVGDRERQNGR
jgi:hypothetical protein